MTPSLKIVSLSKTYHHSKKKMFSRNSHPQETVALSSFNFEFTPGLYGLLGPNGAGKSTLINIITSTLYPTCGEIYWNGNNIHKLQSKYRQIVGYMPQQQQLYEQYTGLEFLTYVAALKEIPRTETKQTVLMCAHRFNLNDQLSKKLNTYSGGMKQRLLAASALIGDPELLIMDEPTAGLDPKERVRLRTFIEEYAKNHIVLIATHVVSDVENIAKEILLLRNGILVDHASTRHLIEKYTPGKTLEDVYLHVFKEEKPNANCTV